MTNKLLIINNIDNHNNAIIIIEYLYQFQIKSLILLLLSSLLLHRSNYDNNHRNNHNNKNNDINYGNSVMNSSNNHHRFNKIQNNSNYHYYQMSSSSSLPLPFTSLFPLFNHKIFIIIIEIMFIIISMNIRTSLTLPLTATTTTIAPAEATSISNLSDQPNNQQQQSLNITSLKSNQIVSLNRNQDQTNQTLIDDFIDFNDDFNDNMTNNCLHFDDILKQYPVEQDCNIDIDIDGRKFMQNDDVPNNAFVNFIQNFKHCHIISGFISLRHIYFDYKSSNSNESTGDSGSNTANSTNSSNPLNPLIFKQFLVFPHVEYIRDFLLVHKFRLLNHSEENYEQINITLGHIFPKLKRIYGYKRVDNLALSISDYWISDHLALNTLQQVCGSVKILSSRPYFRHSPTYWRIVDHYNRSKLFSRMKMFESDHLLPIRFIESNGNDNDINEYIGFEAHLNFAGLISKQMLRVQPKIHTSIYEIDPTFYSFVEHGQRKLPANQTFFCNRTSNLVILSDLNYSDKQFLFPYHTKTFDAHQQLPQWIISNIYDKYINQSSSLHVNFLYNQRLDNIDICRLNTIYYDDHLHSLQYYSIGGSSEANNNNNLNNKSMITNATYQFYFNHYYVIKLELCSSRQSEDCIVHRHFIFNPKSADYEQLMLDLHSDSLNISLLLTLILPIILLIMIGSLITYCLCFIRPYQLFRLKSFVNMDVISVNPDYGIINNNNNDNNNNHLLNPNQMFMMINQQSHQFWSTSYNSQLQSLIAFNNNNNNDTNISCEINREALLLNQQKMLGKGEFGFVYEGQLLLIHDLNCIYHQQSINDDDEKQSINDNNRCNCRASNGNTPAGTIPSIRVAIKQLKENNFTQSTSSSLNKEKFIQEARFMKTFNSNFLVKLLGIVTIDEPILVVMEYMENGDLKRFLRQRYQDYLKSRNSNLLPSFDQLAQMAIQIADGMHYLHSKNIIHRDLAARNCMVASDLTVKIGDFGLTRDLYEKDYYRLSEEAPMPLRWMAPESVRKMIFTPYSDVWSYGIVLWEIMSFGEQPYRGRTDVEVKKLLSSNMRLSRPFYYFEPLWEIAKLCWLKRPHQRPNFAEIIEMLYPHITQNRNQFDNLSYYVSSRTGSYVKYSLYNNCLTFLWNYCLSFRSFSSTTTTAAPSSSSSSSTAGIRKNSLKSSSTSAASTTTSTCPLLSTNQQQQRRDTNSSQQSTSTVIDCGCSKLPLSFQKKKLNKHLNIKSSFKRLNRQLSTCSSLSAATATTTTTNINDNMTTNNNNLNHQVNQDQMIMMNVVYPPAPPPPVSSPQSQSHLHSHSPPPISPNNIPPYGSWLVMNNVTTAANNNVNNNHSIFFPSNPIQFSNHFNQHNNIGNIANHHQQQQQQYLSDEHLHDSRSSITEIPTDSITLSMNNHQNNRNNSILSNQLHSMMSQSSSQHNQNQSLSLLLSEQEQLMDDNDNQNNDIDDDDDNCNYEIMSANVCNYL